MPRLLRFACAFACVCAVAAADAPPSDVPAQIDAALKTFEASIAKEVEPIQHALDSWRQSRRRAAVGDLSTLLRDAKGDDKLYLAWALLAANPKYKPAREAFTKLGVAAPYDEKGAATPDAKRPTCSNRELLDKVAATSYPPFDAVAKVVDAKSSTVRDYVKRQKIALDKLKTDLVALAKATSDARTVESIFTMLAYYDPRAVEVVQYWQSRGKPVPRNRTWFNPIDRYLLDHELAGIDCLRTKSKEGAALGGNGKDPVALTGSPSWRFLEYLANCRVEAVLRASAGQKPTFTVADDQGHGAAVTIDGAKLVVRHVGGEAAPLAEFPLTQDFSALALPLTVEVRKAKIRCAVAGVPVGECALPRGYAYIQVRVDGGGATAQQLRLRFLADEPEAALGEDDVAKNDAAKKPEKPAEPPAEPWRAERDKQLDQPVSFAFADQSFEDVASVLSQVSGVKFTLDAQAESLKDLPVSLSGNDVKLRTALEWLTRLTDIQFVPSADGITCTWHG